MKNAWVAAILNFVTLGLGTVYVGERVLVGLLLTVGGAFLRYEELRIAPAWTGTLSIHWVFAFIGMGVVGVALGLDGYRDAKRVSAASSSGGGLSARPAVAPRRI